MARNGCMCDGAAIIIYNYVPGHHRACRPTNTEQYPWMCYAASTRSSIVFNAVEPVRIPELTKGISSFQASFRTNIPILEIKINIFVLPLSVNSAAHNYNWQVQIGYSTLLESGWNLRSWHKYAGTISQSGNLSGCMYDTNRVGHPRIPQLDINSGPSRS